MRDLIDEAVAQICGREALRLDQAGTIVDRFEQRLYRNRPLQNNRKTIWDRPIVSTLVRTGSGSI